MIGSGSKLNKMLSETTKRINRTGSESELESGLTLRGQDAIDFLKYLGDKSPDKYTQDARECMRDAIKRSKTRAKRNI